jgi:hypothetical protein
VEPEREPEPAAKAEPVSEHEQEPAPEFYVESQPPMALWSEPESFSERDPEEEREIEPEAPPEPKQEAHTVKQEPEIAPLPTYFSGQLKLTRVAYVAPKFDFGSLVAFDPDEIQRELDARMSMAVINPQKKKRGGVHAAQSTRAPAEERIKVRKAQSQWHPMRLQINS